MSPTDLWCVAEPRLCQTGASRTRIPSLCPPWPTQVSWAPTLPLCVTSDWRHRALSPAPQARFLGHLMPWGGAGLGSPAAQGAPRGHRRGQSGLEGRSQVLVASEIPDGSAQSRPQLGARATAAILPPRGPSLVTLLPKARVPCHALCGAAFL